MPCGSPLYHLHNRNRHAPARVMQMQGPFPFFIISRLRTSSTFKSSFVSCRAVAIFIFDSKVMLETTGFSLDRRASTHKPTMSKGTITQSSSRLLCANNDDRPQSKVGYLIHFPDIPGCPLTTQPGPPRSLLRPPRQSITSCSSSCPFHQDRTYLPRRRCHSQPRQSQIDPVKSHA